METVKSFKLANKLPVILAPMAGTKTITALIMVKTGSKYEHRQNNGLSHFVEHMFFKGTVKRPTTLALASELDALGGDYNAFTSKEFTGYYVKVDQKRIGEALEILSDMLLHSKFAAEEIERERGVIIEEINMYEDNPSAQIEDIFETCLYGDTPAGWDTIGTNANVRNFKRADFIKYLTSQYGINGTHIILAGNLNGQDVKKQLTKLFAAYPKNKWQDKVKVVEKQKQPAVKVKFKATDQTHLALGVRAYKSGHKDEYVLRLLAIILGGSMSSRLFIELRERRGLCYYVRTQTEFYSDSGYLVTRAGVPAEKLEEAARVIVDEYRQLTTELVAPAEIKRARDLLRGKLVINLEVSDDLANWYGRQALTRPKLVTPTEFLRLMQKVTAADIQRVAKDIFRDAGLNLAVIGPVKEQKNLEKILKF